LAHVALREDDVQALATIVAGLPGSGPALASGEGDSIAGNPIFLKSEDLFKEFEILQSPGVTLGLLRCPDQFRVAGGINRHSPVAQAAPPDLPCGWGQLRENWADDVGPDGDVEGCRLSVTRANAW